MTCLLDGLRAFPATDVVMLRDGEPGWRNASDLADRIRTEAGIHVTEVQGIDTAAPAA
jgi:hypothetical protein